LEEGSISTTGGGRPGGEEARAAPEAKREQDALTWAHPLNAPKLLFPRDLGAAACLTLWS